MANIVNYHSQRVKNLFYRGQKVKKAYVNGKLAFAGGELKFFKQSTNGTGVNEQMGVSVGEYALFCGGSSGTSFRGNTFYYNKELTKNDAEGLKQSRKGAATTSNGEVAYINGGRSSTSNTASYSSTTDIYTKNLTHRVDTLTLNRGEHAAASNYTISMFYGGMKSPSTYQANIDIIYNGTATHSTISTPEVIKASGGTNIKEFIIFVGGVGSKKATAYNENFTRTDIEELAIAMSKPAATNNGKYAIFAHDKTVESYNENLTKVTCLDLDISRIGAKAVSIDNYSIIAGGTGYEVKADIYNDELTKIDIDQKLLPRRVIAAAVANNYAIIASSDSNTYNSYLEVFEVA